MRQLAVTGLTKSFGTALVLAGLDLEVPAGSLTAILGPSGSGKTTLLRLLAGFERADGGTIVIGDMVVDDAHVHVAPERRRIGYVPQDGSLFPHLTVAANVAFGLRGRGRRARRARGGRTEELLDRVGLGGLGRRYPHQLSGGQQQRVALARALAIEPAVVLLDEPFAALDAHLRASVRADVQRVFREAGTTAILVTHDQEEALSIADRVAVLRDGVIAQVAAPEDLYTRPADPALARFVGDANLLDGVLTGGRALTPLGPLQVGKNHNGMAATSRDPVTVLVRPEQIELAPADAPGPRGTVIGYGYHGHDAVVRVQLTVPESGPSGVPALSGVPETSNASAPSSVSETSGVSATSGVPAPSGVPVPSSVSEILSVPAPSGVPASSGVPAPSGVPASSGVPAPSGVPASSGASAPSGVPASSGAPVPFAGLVITVRVLGGQRVPIGTQVTLRTHGEVIAWQASPVP